MAVFKRIKGVFHGKDASGVWTPCYQLYQEQMQRIFREEGGLAALFKATDTAAGVVGSVPGPTGPTGSTPPTGYNGNDFVVPDYGLPGGGAGPVMTPPGNGGQGKALAEYYTTEKIAAVIGPHLSALREQFGQGLMTYAVMNAFWRDEMATNLGAKGLPTADADKAIVDYVVSKLQAQAETVGKVAGSGM